MTADSVVVSAASTFVLSDGNGDIHPGTPQGFFSGDTRFLSTYILTINRRKPSLLAASALDHGLASFYLSSTLAPNLPAGSVSIVRDRYVDQGLHEDITVVNHASSVRSIRVQLAFNADFADVFEVHGGDLDRVQRTVIERREGHHLCLVYRRAGFRRETRIAFSGEPAIRGRTVVFELELEPKVTWKTCVNVLPVAESSPPPMKCVESVFGGSPFGAYRPAEGPSFDSALDRGAQRDDQGAPTLKTEYPGLLPAYDRAVADLRALRMEHEPDYPILAAGLPWYMAVFGRDSIISAFQTKLLGPELMIGTLHTLASLQAKDVDDFRDAQPGKMPHEVRRGEISFLEDARPARYYGSVDATPLFLVLLHEAYLWTGDQELLRLLLPAAEAALRWIDQYGDSDGDGFVEYRRRSQKGLYNQGWKDTDGAISFANGALAQGPVALVEVQGYVYDAKRRMAEVYRVLGQPEEARRLTEAAENLRRQFNEAFWMPDEGCYAVALDGRKRQVDSITSNSGHCLWSGIVDEAKAPKLAERLTAPDMFSGWGIRTLSTEMVRYHPASYHNGSIWPHDNSLISAGLARYGFVKEAHKIAGAIIDASVSFPDRSLPELFSGYPRRQYSVPVPYPVAHVPQAWAAGALVHFLEIILGARTAGDQLLAAPFPDGITVCLDNVQFRGSRLGLG